MAQHQWQRVFADVHKFRDDIWGQIDLNYLERDVIDTPEFQRLFRTSQLGFVDLIYQTANHTRGAHSIGACFVANSLIDRLAENTTHDGPGSRYAPIDISDAERVLIRLGALLHDITHVPFSHDIERKTHRVYFSTAPDDFMRVQSYYGHYDKHDAFASNPLLYLTFFDTEKSVLARVLKAYSRPFYEMLLQTKNDVRHPHLQTFLTLLGEAKREHEWDPAKELLPSLLFHLLTYETMEEAEEDTQEILTRYPAGDPELVQWGLGPAALRRKMHAAWYQPFRHDIIGNTLSADLIDYLKRDMRRLAMDRECDLFLLNYYVLINPDSTQFTSENTQAPKAADAIEWPARYRCAIEVQDQKRGTSRVGLINDIFRLLDLRHEIHEKAVMHRVTQSANAMFSRALLLMREAKPRPETLVRLGDDAHALQGEELFLHSLLEMKPPEANATLNGSFKESHRIIKKLIDRRVYRPLVIIPGDRAARRFQCAGNRAGPAAQTEYLLRTLGTVVDSRYYSAFLLFVSTCIEEFLAGLFSSEAELARHVTCALEDPELTKQMMSLVPSRVIIWTSPYKQLYKDPAVVVALKNRIAPVDKLAGGIPGDASSDASVIDRVQTSIRDADSKYAALWKLYVFVSDGLYYTGILNKLKMAASAHNSSEHDGHVKRLRIAEAFAVAAIEAVVETWSKYCERVGDTAGRQRRLTGDMLANQFAPLVDLWLSKFNANESRDQDPTGGLSEVDIEHYVHEWDVSGCPVEDKCRDIRYKYPVPANALWVAAKLHAEDSLDHQLVAFLEHCGVTDASLLSTAEFRQLLGQMHGPVLDKCQSLLKTNGSAKPHPAHLDVLWPSALGEPAPEKPSTRKPVELPRTRNDTKKWLRTEAMALSPHVRSRFTKDLEPILDLLFQEIDAESAREQAMLDLRSRIVNEGTKIFNNFKTRQVVKALRRKWSTRKGEEGNQPDAVAEV